MKIHKVHNARPGEPDFLFNCPGCGCDHGIWVPYVGATHATWEFNGNLDKPTVNPSILVNAGRLNPTIHTCHSFIKDGMIQFLSDCTHELAGQTVELPEYE
jgi:hypothetical protein